MPDYFTVVASGDEDIARLRAGDVLDDVFEYAHLDWVTDITLTILLSLLRGDGPLDTRGLHDREGLARFGKVHDEFDVIYEDGKDHFVCVIVPQELVERVVALSPEASKEAMLAWGKSKAMRFEGKDWDDANYWSWVEGSFTDFQRLCRLAQETAKNIVLCILV